MNDFSEVQHGQNCLQASWRDEALGGRMRRILDHIAPGASSELEQAFDARHVDRFGESYMISVSEHGSDDVDEDRYGRLSMWRAYGGATNIAFVFNSAPFLRPSNALNAFTSPVLYKDIEGFKQDLLELVESLETAEDLLAALSPGELQGHVAEVFHNAVLSTKHPGFKEEREWRVIHSPTLRASDRLRPTVETIGGVPQRVYNLEFKNYPNEGFTGATVPELLDRIIIGPTQYPWPMWDAFVRLLNSLQVLEPERKSGCFRRLHPSVTYLDAVCTTRPCCLRLMGKPPARRRTELCRSLADQPLPRRVLQRTWRLGPARKYTVLQNAA